jgi:hypothetical protein
MLFLLLPEITEIGVLESIVCGNLRPVMFPVNIVCCGEANKALSGCRKVRGRIAQLDALLIGSLTENWPQA